MKKIVLVLLVFVFFVSFAFTAPLVPEEKALLEKIEQLCQKKDYEKENDCMDRFAADGDGMVKYWNGPGTKAD